MRAEILVVLQITMPKDNLHYGDVEHRNLHNLYGTLFHQGTAEVAHLVLSQGSVVLRCCCCVVPPYQVLHGISGTGRAGEGAVRHRW